MNEANNQGKGWTLGEDRTVADMHESMQSLHSIAARLGRTELAIRYRLDKLGLKTRMMDGGYARDRYIKFGEKEPKPAAGKCPAGSITQRDPYAEVAKAVQGMSAAMENTWCENTIQAGVKSPYTGYDHVYIAPHGDQKSNTGGNTTFRGADVVWDCGSKTPYKEYSNGDIKGLDALIDGLIAGDPGVAWRTSDHFGRWSEKGMTAAMENMWRECAKHPAPDLIPIGRHAQETLEQLVGENCSATAVEMNNAINLRETKMRARDKISDIVGKPFIEMDFAEMEARVNAHIEKGIEEAMGWAKIEASGKPNCDFETFSSFCPLPRARFGDGDGVAEAMNLREATSKSVVKHFPEADFAEIEARVNKSMRTFNEVRAHTCDYDGRHMKTFSSFCPPPRARFGTVDYQEESSDKTVYFLNETGLNALNLEKTKMSKKFFETRKQILVNGCVHTEQEIKDNAAAFASMTQTEDTRIKSLESITAQTKALKREITERRANLAEFVTFVDSLEPSDVPQATDA